MRLSIDVGGTFTDLVLVDDDGAVRVDKVPSTPGSGAAVTHGIARMVARAGVPATALDMRFHGFTIATNAWLTRTGAKVVAVVTEGFRDVLAIGSQRRPETYNLAGSKPEPLVPRSHVVEVRERGDDVREFALLPFDGAGGLFAGWLLRELDLREAIVPRHPGVFAALGLHHADPRHHAQAPFPAALDRLDPARLRSVAEPAA